MNRIGKIDTVLSGCLNWQERHACIFGADERLVGLDYGQRMRRRVTELWLTGQAKKLFLWHELVWCLNNNDLWRPPRHADLENVMEDDDLYFIALSFARLFRALLFKRHTVPTRPVVKWNDGGVFHYHAGDRDVVFPRAALLSGLARRTPAERLAKRLQSNADCLVRIIRNLEQKQRECLRDAVINDFAGLDGIDENFRMHLLNIWKRSREGPRKDQLPFIDEIWGRMSDCKFSKDCLEYDEFHFHEILQHHDEAGMQKREQAREKLDVLTGSEERAASEEPVGDQWRRVARNWMCRGFGRRFYEWVESKGPRRARLCNGRGLVDLDEEVGGVRMYIEERDGSEAYGKVRSFAMQYVFFRRERKDYSAAVRMATAGYGIDDIGSELDWPGGRADLYSFLFLVAAQRAGKRVQECWDLHPAKRGRDDE